MRLTGDSEASSETLGQAVILGITVMGISMVTLTFLPIMQALENTVTGINVDHTFAMFDADANRAILGDMPPQILDINLGGGSLWVEPNGTGKESYITVNRENENDVVKIQMGKINHRLGDRAISYEGGGLWYENSDGSKMISPPKVNYDGVTLTLPGISISGSGSASGKGYASVSIKKNTTQILYPDASVPNRTNPVNSNGAVYVNVTSEFYKAWAEYLTSLGYAKVSSDDRTRTVSLKLSSVPSTLGGNTPITDPITLRGLDPGAPDPINNFSFRLVPFNDAFDWDIHAFSGKKKLIYHIKGPAKNLGDLIDINVGYQDDGSGFGQPAETWTGHNVLTLQGQDGNAYVDVNLLDTMIKLGYNKTDVGAGKNGISHGDSNDSGFSWPKVPVPLTRRYNWSFNNGSGQWKSNFTTNLGNVAMGNSTDGNGSLYSRLTGSFYYATTTWASPNFTWNNGTPASASLYFDWKVATYAIPGSFYVLLVKPNGTSQIYPTTAFTGASSWSTKNTSLSVNDFSQNGNYSLKLVAKLNTSSTPYTTEEVRWNNPTIFLNATGTGNSLTDKSLFEITEHYIGNMIADGDISFYQSYAPGKYPATGSTMLLNYNSTRAPIYLYVSQNDAEVSIRT